MLRACSGRDETETGEAAELRFSFTLKLDPEEQQKKFEAQISADRARRETMRKITQSLLAEIDTVKDIVDFPDSYKVASRKQNPSVALFHKTMLEHGIRTMRVGLIGL